MSIEVVDGLLQRQPVEAIVVPRRKEYASILAAAGRATLDELAVKPPLKPGNSIVTTGGDLAYRGIVHVADFDDSGRSSEQLVMTTVQNAIATIEKSNFWSVAFPVLGVYPGALVECDALARMLQTLYEMKVMGTFVIVRESD